MSDTSLSGINPLGAGFKCVLGHLAQLCVAEGMQSRGGCGAVHSLAAFMQNCQS